MDMNPAVRNPFLKRKNRTMLTRRRFGVITGGVLASFALGGAGFGRVVARQANDGRLTARPRTDIKTSSNKQGPLGLGRTRDAILQLPVTASRAPLPLLVMFHGGNGSAAGVLGRLGSAPGDAGVAVLAPDSRGSSWSETRSGFGPDISFVNRALEHVFETVAIDARRLAIGGFSDGATYALALGLINGDLFPWVLAFSPAVLVAGTPHGTPRIFISHGDADPVLPIDRCSRRIVPSLRSRGYDVTYREFAGAHEIPADIATSGMKWVTGSSSLQSR